ncbi:TPA: S8 family peptidase [Bacillus cereus]|nr:S8 family peptidase [Bacillus cereus]
MPNDKIPTQLDPRLQKAILKNQQKEINILDESAHEDALISVIAKVTDFENFCAIPGVHHGNDITMAPDKSGRIVTAKVSVTELEKIQQSPVVLSLKGAQSLRPLLKDTTKEIHVPHVIETENEDVRGQGVIIGIVDHGCDFVHRNFRRDDGSTRLLALWDQRNNKIHSKEKINEALHDTDPYDFLGYDVSKEDPQRRTHAEHGTHVMDIAAGNGLGTGISGVAPDAELIFVEPAYWDIPEGELGNFGDSANLLNAIKFIFDQAEDRPCVINVSLGTNGGPHDGTSPVEIGIDGLLIEKPNRSIVIAAGNSYDDNIHATGSVPLDGHVDLQWNILEGDNTINEVEIWYDSEDEFRLEILNPENESIGSIGLGEHFTKSQVFATQVRHDNENGDNVAMVFYPLQGSAPAGIWTIRLHGVRITNGKFHAWIERDNHRRRTQSNFSPPNDNTYTLGSICCGHKSIVVGSYDAKSPSTPISYFSSAGPTRDERKKPEISAPGGTYPPDGLPVQAAASRTLNGKTGMAGTSMAAPAVTGVIALILAKAKAHNLTLTIDQIRSIVQQSARSHPPAREGWDNRYGFGRIDARAALALVTEMVDNSESPRVISQPAIRK